MPVDLDNSEGPKVSADDPDPTQVARNLPKTVAGEA
jgi:hypothetical protein